MKPLKIGFDAKRLFLNYTGLGNYSRMIVSSLQNKYPQNEYYLFSTKKIETKQTEGILRHSNTNVHLPKAPYSWFKSLWRSFGISGLIQSNHLDIYHGLSHELPFGSCGKTKLIVTIHDLIFMRYPELYNPIDCKIYLAKWKYACQKADKIIAVSEQTKQDIIYFLGTDPAKIDVVYQGCAEIFKEPASQNKKEEVQKKYNLPDQYLLCIGTLEKRKNLLLILKAMCRLESEIKLVAVGRKTTYFGQELLPFIENNQLKDRVVFLHNVKYEDLPVIYQSAEIFVYPSVFEGFGIPILEALHSDVPVISSIGSCFSEAGGKGSVYINPQDDYALSEAIKKLWNNKELRSQMIQAGREHRQLFLNDKIADDIMKCYQSVL